MEGPPRVRRGRPPKAMADSDSSDSDNAKPSDVIRRRRRRKPVDDADRTRAISALSLQVGAAFLSLADGAVPWSEGKKAVEACVTRSGGGCVAKRLAAAGEWAEEIALAVSVIGYGIILGMEWYAARGKANDASTLKIGQRFPAGKGNHGNQIFAEIVPAPPDSGAAGAGENVLAP